MCLGGEGGGVTLGRRGKVFITPLVQRAEREAFGMGPPTKHGMFQAQRRFLFFCFRKGHASDESHF